MLTSIPCSWSQQIFEVYSDTTDYFTLEKSIFSKTTNHHSLALYTKLFKTRCKFHEFWLILFLHNFLDQHCLEHLVNSLHNSEGKVLEIRSYWNRKLSFSYCVFPSEPRGGHKDHQRAGALSCENSLGQLGLFSLERGGCRETLELLPVP